MTSKKGKGDPASPFAKLQALKDKMEAAAREEAKPTKAAKGTPPTKGPGVAAPSSRSVPSPKVATGGPSDDDAYEFHRLMSGVTPLAGRNKRVALSTAAFDLEPSSPPSSAEASAEAEAREAAAVRDHLRTLVEGGSRFEVLDDGRRVEGRRIEVPHDVVRKLRRGQFPIDARIDLHGRNVVEAQTELHSFLSAHRSRGERCVLVVHGKGEHSPAGFGVLRGEIGAWLSQGRASEHVSAFATAHQDDGGEGAVYVLLRR